MSKKVTSSVQKPLLQAIEAVQMLAICINPAETNPEEAGAPTRDETEWFVVVPELALVFKPTDKKGNPIKGYWGRSEAIAYVNAYVRKAIANPDYMRYMWEHPETVPLIDGTYGKLMPITITL